MRVLPTAVLLLSCFYGFAQFSDLSYQLEELNVDITNPDFSYGGGVSFYDFNGDGWDDLSIGGGTHAPVFLLNNNGVYEQSAINIPHNGLGNMQSLLWVDVNNDGHSDLFISKDGGPLELWMNDGALNFTNVIGTSGLPMGIHKFTNAAFADFDHDGCLDVYVSLYYNHANFQGYAYVSKLFTGHCDGTFTDVTIDSGVFLEPRTTLQPVFVDVNNDGWEDLFLAVDRIPYANELFISNQDGTFTRVTETSGVNNYICAMSATVGDYNHDGYMDIYVTNNPVETGNSLFMNNGDESFTDVAVEMEVNIMLTGWGALWLDYNNNSWEDLFVSIMSYDVIPNPGNKMFVNNQGMSFTEFSDELGVNDIVTETFTCAMGDINNDGYYDFITNNRQPSTPRLFQNQGGENNYLSVTLEGTLANRDGIGTWIHCYMDGQHLLRYTHCSENLAGQNSRKKIFGLGQVNQVDSLVLEWNSGTREVYINPEINSHEYYIEGASFTQPYPLGYSGQLTFCSGDSVVIDGGDYVSHLWNTGHTERYLTVYQSGTYTVEVINQFGFSVPSLPVNVTVYPTTEVSFTILDVSCTGAANGSILAELDTGAPLWIFWDNGATEPLNTNLSGGLYSFIAEDANGCPVSGTVPVDEPSPLLAQVVAEDVKCYGDSSGYAELNVLGGIPPYEFDWNNSHPDTLSAGTYVVWITDANLCGLEMNFTISQPDSIWVTFELSPATDENNGAASVQIFGGTPPFSTTWSTGDSGTLVLEGLSPGDYSLSVTDAHNCTNETGFTIQTASSTESTQLSTLRVFPNPAKNQVVLEGCAEGAELQLFDAYGRIVHTQMVSGLSEVISVAHLSAGSYLLRISEADISRTLRLVVMNH